MTERLHIIKTHWQKSRFRYCIHITMELCSTLIFRPWIHHAIWILQHLATLAWNTSQCYIAWCIHGIIDHMECPSEKPTCCIGHTITHSYIDFFWKQFLLSLGLSCDRHRLVFSIATGNIYHTDYSTALTYRGTVQQEKKTDNKWARRGVRERDIIHWGETEEIG